MLVKEGHAQLLYRFCVPIASYILWSFSNNPRLFKISLLSLIVVWQLSFTFYIGYFLVILLVAMILVLPFYKAKLSLTHFFNFWFEKLKKSWLNAMKWERILSILAILVSIILFLFLVYPYLQVTHLYGFKRSVGEIVTMLPRLQSYLLADSSQLWRSNATIFSSIPMRHEHQLFPGLSVYLLILIGVIWNHKSPNQKLAQVNLLSVLLMVILTLYIYDFSFYRVLATLPGFNSIRAVTRIILVLMWPISVYISTVIDSLLDRNKSRLISKILVVSLSLLLVLESTSFNHYTFSKQEAQNRIDNYLHLFNTEKMVIDEESILFLGPSGSDPYFVTEIDAMLLSQKLGIATLHGYSGTFPHGYKVTEECDQISQRILSYMEFDGIDDPGFFQDLMDRVVLLNMDHCDLSKN